MAATRIRTLEEGNIYFFYRPRVEQEEVRGRRDVQRFYMVLAPQRPKRVFRLFVLGRKKLPAVLHGVRHPERRNWALNVATSRDPADIRRALAAEEYSTETRGERFVGAAKPVGEGRYRLLQHEDHTEIAYALELPEEPGPAQEEFEVLKEASYIVSVKNPGVSTPGAPSAEAEPAYPDRLRERFGNLRWLDADDPELLDYENTQILMIGAHAGEEVEEELGIRLEPEKERLASADVFKELKVPLDRKLVTPLISGEFPAREEAPPEASTESTTKASKGESPDASMAAEETEAPKAREVRRLSPEESPSARGKAGGRAAAARAPSAAALTKLLGGIDFPKSRAAIVAHAGKNRDRIENPDEALEVLGQLPDRTYESMADVASGLGEVR